MQRCTSQPSSEDHLWLRVAIEVFRATETGLCNSHRITVLRHPWWSTVACLHELPAKHKQPDIYAWTLYHSPLIHLYFSGGFSHIQCRDRQDAYNHENSPGLMLRRNFARRLRYMQWWSHGHMHPNPWAEDCRSDIKTNSKSDSSVVLHWFHCFVAFHDHTSHNGMEIFMTRNMK